MPRPFQLLNRYVLFTSLFGCVLLWAQAALGADASSDIERGVADYRAAMESGDRNERLQLFARAEQLFRQAATQQINSAGVASTELLVNLGNAALQAEHIGSAVLAYRRALWQHPGHSRAHQNLQFARGLLPESLRADTVSQWSDTLFFWKSVLSRSQLLLLSAVCFCAAAFILTISLSTGLAWLRFVAWALLMIWFVLMVSCWWGVQDPGAEAVVMVDGAFLHAADSENSPLRLADPLPDGAEVRILESRDRWIEIEINGRTGWLNASHIEYLHRGMSTELESIQ